MFRKGYAVCTRDRGTQIIAMPENGCAFWMRALGIDDDADVRPGWSRLIKGDKNG